MPTQLSWVETHAKDTVQYTEILPYKLRTKYNTIKDVEQIKDNKIIRDRSKNIVSCVCVCVCVCIMYIYVCMYIYIYVCMYVCM